MQKLLKKELRSLPRSRGLLVAIALLLVVSAWSSSNAFLGRDALHPDNLNVLNAASGTHAETYEEFLEWYSTEHFRDFIFRKSIENNVFAPLLCGLLLGLFFFALPDYRRESSAALFTGTSRRSWFGTKLFLYLLLTLLIVDLPMVVLFAFKTPRWIGWLPSYGLRDLLFWAAFQLAAAANFCLVMVLTKSIVKNVGLGLLLAVASIVMSGMSWSAMGIDQSAVWYNALLFLLFPAAFPLGGQASSLLLAGEVPAINFWLVTGTLAAAVPLHICAAWLIWRRRDLQ